MPEPIRDKATSTETIKSVTEWIPMSQDSTAKLKKQIEETHKGVFGPYFEIFPQAMIPVLPDDPEAGAHLSAQVNLLMKFSAESHCFPGALITKLDENEQSLGNGVVILFTGEEEKAKTNLQTAIIAVNENVLKHLNSAPIPDLLT